MKRSVLKSREDEIPVRLFKKKRSATCARSEAMRRPPAITQLWIDWLDWKGGKHARGLVNLGSRMGYGVSGRRSDGGGAERA